MISYHAYAAISEEHQLSPNASGVRMRPARFYFPSKLEQDPGQSHKMEEIMAAGVTGVKQHSSFDLEQQDLLSRDQHIDDMYGIDSPTIDSDQGMQWLLRLVRDKGGQFVTKTIHGDLVQQQDQLLARFQADVIVHATGLGAQELAADDSCYPVRGALIRAINNGVHYPPVTEAHTVNADVSGGAKEIIFIVPRNDHIILRGGIAEDHVGSMDLTMDSPEVNDIWKRRVRFMPCLEKAQVHSSYPLAVGLRPFRHGNVRVERELDSAMDGGSGRIVHSYGQGGAGWTLAFGCASDVAELVEEVLSGFPPRALKDEGTVKRDANPLAVPKPKL